MAAAVRGSHSTRKNRASGGNFGVRENSLPGARLRFISAFE
jgi:hypothetical protein